MKRWISVLLIIIILSGMDTVSFAEGRAILAVGDSISAGYGLSDRVKECFVSLMAEEGDTVINKAVDGNEAPDIISQLTDEENENYIAEDTIKKADIVTITCGGNDMMDLLYEKIAEAYPDYHPKHWTITKDEVLSELADGNAYALTAALNVLNSKRDIYYMKDGDFDIRLAEFTENLLWITDYIHTINPAVKIVVATQYNPYVEFEKSFAYGVIYRGMEDGAVRLNEAIKENAEAGGYTVCDIKAAFDGYSGSEDLYNANPQSGSFNLDFHPTKAGHELIAEKFGEIINKKHRLGIENEDGTYSLPDDVVGYYITNAQSETRFLGAGVYVAEEGDSVHEVYINVKLVEGAQVKLDGSALRFIATVDRSSFDAMGYGMALTSEGSEEKFEVEAQNWQSDTCFTVKIENLRKENYSRKYTATPFVRVRYDNGEEKVIYGTRTVTRSAYEVASGLTEKEETEEELKEALKVYLE